jgi:heat shock protein HslJ
MSAPEDPRIWQGLRAHLDELGSVANVPPIGVILDRGRSRRSHRVAAGLAGVGAIVLAIGLLLPALRAVTTPMTGATPRSSSAQPTSAAVPTSVPVDLAELIGHTYVATDVTENGQPIAIVPETQLQLGFGASQFGADAGCNHLGGDYQIRDGRLIISNGQMTAIGCLGELGRQEGWYYTFLQSSPTISMDSTGIVLTNGDTVVTFVDEVFASPMPTRDVTWVAVIGPADARPPEDLVLEIGGMAWDGYGGVVSLPTSGSTEVRLLGRETCRTYAKFVAKSGSMSVIRFSKDGQVTIEDVTGRGIEAGPALAHRQLSDCPDT